MPRERSSRRFPGGESGPRPGSSPGSPGAVDRGGIATGAGAVMAISSGKPCQGMALAAVFLRGSDEIQELARTRPFPRDLLVQWTVGVSPLGVGLTGRGLASSPVSASCLQRPDSIPPDCHPPVTPPGGGDSAGGYPGKAVPGDANPRAVRNTIDKSRAPVIENRCTIRQGGRAGCAGRCRSGSRRRRPRSSARRSGRPNRLSAPRQRRERMLRRRS